MGWAVDLDGGFGAVDLVGGCHSEFLVDNVLGTELALVVEHALYLPVGVAGDDAQAQGFLVADEGA